MQLIFIDIYHIMIETETFVNIYDSKLFAFYNKYHVAEIIIFQS